MKARPRNRRPNQQQVHRRNEVPRNEISTTLAPLEPVKVDAIGNPVVVEETVADNSDNEVIYPEGMDSSLGQVIPPITNAHGGQVLEDFDYLYPPDAVDPTVTPPEEILEDYDYLNPPFQHTNPVAKPNDIRNDLDYINPPDVNKPVIAPEFSNDLDSIKPHPNEDVLIANHKPHQDPSQPTTDLDEVIDVLDIDDDEIDDYYYYENNYIKDLKPPPQVKIKVTSTSLSEWPKSKVPQYNPTYIPHLKKGHEHYGIPNYNFPLLK